MKLHLRSEIIRILTPFSVALSAFVLVLFSQVPALADQSASSAPPQAAQNAHPAAASDFPPGEGRDIFLRTCSKCHSPTIVRAYGQKREGWENTITKMMRLGATGSDEDFTDISDYLTANFPPSAITKIFVNKATEQQIASVLAVTPDEAKAIIAYRDKVGGFKSLDDMKKVPNIDPKKIDAKKDNLVF